MAGFQPVLRGGRAPTLTQLHGTNGVRRQQRFTQLVGGSSEAIHRDVRGIRCCRSYCRRCHQGRSAGFPNPDDFVHRGRQKLPWEFIKKSITGDRRVPPAGPSESGFL